MHSNVLPPTEFVLDTGAVLNLVNTSLVHNERTSHIRQANLVRLFNATKDPVFIHESLQLYLRTSDQTTRVWFEIPLNLGVSLIPGTSF